MFNLEKLDLFLIIICKNGFVDGNNLKENIINQMLKLKSFTFNIRSTIHLNNHQTNLLSNQDIQNTFNNFLNNQIISCVDYFSEMKQGQCHIYSTPYEWKTYDQITNNFPCGIFQYVRKVSIFDEKPFEHAFFVQISKSFPFMKKLSVINEKPQNDKNHCLTINEYPYLSELNLGEAHDDYLEEFLTHTRTCLSNNLYLIVEYEVLERVTRRFTSQTTRDNCKKLRYLDLIEKYTISKRIKKYFPYTKIV